MLLVLCCASDPWVKQPNGEYALMDLWIPIYAKDAKPGRVLHSGKPVADWVCMRGSSLLESFHAATNGISPGANAREALVSLLLRQVCGALAWWPALRLLPCPSLSCPALRRPALPCPALPCPVVVGAA